MSNNPAVCVSGVDGEREVKTFNKPSRRTIKGGGDEKVEAEKRRTILLCRPLWFNSLGEKLILL